MVTLFIMLRPTTATFLPCFSAASITCWMREIRDAKVAIITRPGAWPMARSSASPTICSDSVYPSTSA